MPCHSLEPNTADPTTPIPNNGEGMQMMDKQFSNKVKAGASSQSLGGT